MKTCRGLSRKRQVKKSTFFGKNGGVHLADQLRTDLLGQLPLGQPDWDDEDFAPSIYAADHPIGKVYDDIAQRVIDKTAK